MENTLIFVHLVFVGFVTLFPPVNPIGTALIMDPLLHGLDSSSRKNASFRIAFYCFAICTVTVLVGSWLLKLFGISLPVVQLAGGILICKMGWQFLSSNTSAKDSQESPMAIPGREAIESVLFYPLAFPMTTGAGTISVLLTLSAHVHTEDLSSYILNYGSLLIAVILMCTLIYLSYAYTPALLRKLGSRGEEVVNRISAFLVFCVGIQIATEGIRALLRS